MSDPVSAQSETLLDLKPGETGVVANVQLPAQIQQLLVRFGFVNGAEVRFSRSAPLGDPLLYSIEGSEVALRADTAVHIFIASRNGSKNGTSPNGTGNVYASKAQKTSSTKDRGAR